MMGRIGGMRIAKLVIALALVGANVAVWGGDENDDGAIDVAEVKKCLRMRPLPVPSAEKIAAAARSVKELCGSDVADLEAKKLSNVEFAKKLMAYSKQTEDPTVKFVLYRNTFRQLLLGGAIAEAEHFLDLIFVRYGGQVATAVAQFSKSIVNKMADAPMTARKMKGLKSFYDDLVKCDAELSAAEEELMKRPSNSALLRKQARSLMKFMDWEPALRFYAKDFDERNDACIWEVADEDKRTKDFTCEKIGDYWWSVIDGKDEHRLLFKSVSYHAALWYQLAIAEGKMSELKTKLVNVRLAKATGFRTANESETSGDEPASAEEAPADEAATEGVTLIPSADVEQTEWRYVQTDPGIGWQRISYNDRNWKTGRSGFGTPNARLFSSCGGCHWNSRELYLRKVFDCKYDAKQIVTAKMKFAIDDEIDIWLNGEQVFRHRHAGEAQYRDVYPMEAIPKRLKKGKNVIAIKAANTGGAGFIDVGVWIEVKKNNSARKSW